MKYIFIALVLINSGCAISPEMREGLAQWGQQQNSQPVQPMSYQPYYQAPKAQYCNVQSLGYGDYRTTCQPGY